MHFTSAFLHANCSSGDSTLKAWTRSSKCLSCRRQASLVLRSQTNEKKLARSTKQTLGTEMSGEPPKNTQMWPPQKRWQKSDKTIVLNTKSPELLIKHLGFMSPIAQRCSLIYSANSRDQNWCSNTKKHTIAASSEKMAKK